MGFGVLILLGVELLVAGLLSVLLQRQRPHLWRSWLRATALLLRPSAPSVPEAAIVKLEADERHERSTQELGLTESAVAGASGSPEEARGNAAQQTTADGRDTAALTSSSV
jgi:hypothetical protein